MSVGQRLTMTLLLTLSGVPMVASSAQAASNFVINLYTITGGTANPTNFRYQYSYVHPSTGLNTSYPTTGPGPIGTNPRQITVPTVSTADTRVTFTISNVSTGEVQTVVVPGNRTVATPIHLSFGVATFAPLSHSFPVHIPSCGCVPILPHPCCPPTVWYSTACTVSDCTCPSCQPIQCAGYCDY